jgi:hypothetical protein
MKDFTCPDSAHLDSRDRTRYTDALAAHVRWE